MNLLNQGEVTSIANKFGYLNVTSWCFEEFSDKIIGYLGDHLKLLIDVETNREKKQLNLFVKCMPQLDKWKAQYITELKFFKKEYVMLNSLFREFENLKGKQKWRPDLLFCKEEILVFENVSLLGYNMPHHQDTISFEKLKECVVTLARFHSQSYIFEEKRSKDLQRPYRISEDYYEYLQEPVRGLDWRDTGRNAVIDFLRVHSKYKSKPNFARHIQSIIPQLFTAAMDLMKPSSKHRNAVVHRDLWTNNMLMKKDKDSYHVLFVDFQTVLYCSPMLDLSSLIYLNTTRECRDNYTEKLFDHYYHVLSEELLNACIKVESMFEKATLWNAYEESVVFGITQAALITPIVAMSSKRRDQIFCDPKSAKRANVETRSNEILETAKQDNKYYTRVAELFDEIVERYIFPTE